MVCCGGCVDVGQTGGGAGVATVFGDSDVPIWREEADDGAAGGVVGFSAEGSQCRGEEDRGAHVDGIFFCIWKH